VRSAVIDTNVLVYDAFVDQPMHQDAKDLLDSLDEWVIPSIVLIELTWFARGAGLTLRDARSLILGYALSKNVRIIEISQEDLVDALTSVSNLSELEDALILCVAERMKLPLATFDGEMRKRAAERGVDVIP